MTQSETTPPLSALEHTIIATLQRRSEGRAIITDLAQHMRVPEGTVRFGLQWLMSYRLVQYDGERYQLCSEADPA